MRGGRGGGIRTNLTVVFLSGVIFFVVTSGSKEKYRVRIMRTHSVRTVLIVYTHVRTYVLTHVRIFFVTTNFKKSVAKEISTKKFKNFTIVHTKKTYPFLPGRGLGKVPILGQGLG